MTAAHVLSVVIPAYNEERYIATTLERVLAVDLSMVGFSREVIVVDDHSSDRTPEIAGTFSERLWSTVCRGTRERAAPFERRLRSHAGTTWSSRTLTSNTTRRPSSRCCRALAETGADAVYGSRYLNAGRHPRQSRLAYLGGRSLSVAVKLLTGRWLSDVTTALKLLPLPLIRSLELSSSGFELEAEITAKLLARGCRIVEVPVSYHPRTRRRARKSPSGICCGASPRSSAFAEVDRPQTTGYCRMLNNLR